LCKFQSSVEFFWFWFWFFVLLGFWILQQAASNLAASDLEVMENGEDDEMVMAKTERIVGDHGDGHEEIMMKKEFEELEYQNGFGNHCVTEALKGALPVKQNSPLKCPYGLYAEQISGTAFTVPRKLNQRSWLYRIKPSVTHEPFHPREPAHKRLVSDFTGSGVASVTPTQLRWKPPPIPEAHTNFIDGLFTVCGAGSPFLRHGFAVHMYVHMIPFPSFCAIRVLLLFHRLEKSLQISYCNHGPQVHGNFFLLHH
jgi:hypothetical protein